MSEFLYKKFTQTIPDDHSKQVKGEYYLSEIINKLVKIEPELPEIKVIDIGCGDGKSIDTFLSIDKRINWKGIDIEDSPEVKTRTRPDKEFITFDGVNLPFNNNEVDLAFSKQVFEHVRKPESLLREIHRVLKPGGVFTGSVSTLEPYHSYSYWNYTPYGWFVLLNDAGFLDCEFRPGIDSIALIQRQYLGRPKHVRKWFSSSPLNEEIETIGKNKNKSIKEINIQKIQYCGHLIFRADK